MNQFKKNKTPKYISGIIIISGGVAAESYLLYTYVEKYYISIGEEYMNTGGLVAIVVALISVAGGIWCQCVLFKRDGLRIDDLNTQAGKVKADTSEIKPDVKTINENVKKVRDEVVEKVVPNMQKLDGVDVLVQAYRVEQEIRKRQSPNLAEQEILKGAIDNVYMENSRLMDMYRNEKQKSQELETKNKMLKLKNESLEKEIIGLKKDKIRKSIDRGPSL